LVGAGRKLSGGRSGKKAIEFPGQNRVRWARLAKRVHPGPPNARTLDDLLYIGEEEREEYQISSQRNSEVRKHIEFLTILLQDY